MDRILAEWEAARAFQPEAFLDIGLPGSTVTIWRSSYGTPRGLREVLLVALTGYGQAGDRRRALESGLPNS